MASVSLILPLAPGARLLAGHVDAVRCAVEASGHELEVLAVADPRNPEVLAGVGPSVRTLLADQPGKAAAAYRGLHEASGDFLVVLDLEKGYEPEAVRRVLEPLVSGQAELVVASSSRGATGSSGGVSPLESGLVHSPSAHRAHAPRWALGKLLRPLTGITDPSCGLLAVTRESYRAREQQLTPLGSRFVLELLVGSVGRRLEVPVPRAVRPRRLVFRSNDLRLIKRLADDRFGNYSRLLQFCVVGASGMVVDLSCYALFQVVLAHTALAGLTVSLFGARQPLDLAAAGALAIAIALVWNFSLNRRLTFNDARHGSIPRQFVTYALGNALGIALSFSLRLFLPSRIGFFQRHKLAAAVVGIVAATGISFSMSRWVVFHRRRRGPDSRHPSSQAALAERL
jgi:dolichol-phosphate mannosyltransferase